MAENGAKEDPQQVQEVLAEEREGEEVVEPPRKRFKITSEEEENAWSLPDEMLEYVNEQFEKYIKEKDLKESIMSLHPIPSNMRKVKKLDMFLQELMKDARKKNELDLETTFEKLQQKLFAIMGPLGRIWKSVDQQVRGIATEEETLSLPEAADLLEQSVLLLGQCSNTITYERRKNVLSSILTGGSSQVPTMLKDKGNPFK